MFFNQLKRATLLQSGVSQQMLMQQSRCFGNLAQIRKMKVHHMSYTQVPSWLKKQQRDPFDYELRSKEEVMRQHKYYPPDFQWKLEFSKFPSGDVREHGDTRIDHRDKIAKITFDLRDLNLSPEQRERFVFLLGPRYKGSHINKIVCKQFMTFQENYLRALEQLREIYWEALRAPDRCATLTRNPYRREKIIKKEFGKTKEERQAKKQELKQQLIDHEKKVDEDLINAEIYQTDVVDKKNSARRRDIAKRRLKLGFNDKGAEEMDDAQIDYLEHIKYAHDNKVLEASDRKQVKMPAELDGLSIQDKLNKVVRPGEEFKNV